MLDLIFGRPPPALGSDGQHYTIPGGAQGEPLTYGEMFVRREGMCPIVRFRENKFENFISEF